MRNHRLFGVQFSLVLFVLLLFVGCSDKGLTGGGGVDGPGPDYWASLFDWSQLATWDDPANWSDDKLRSFAYSGHYKHPEFYEEDFSRGSPSYVTEQWARVGQERSVELATMSRDTAYAWAETAAVHLAYYREIESELENEKYFEFRRVYSENTNDVILSRVHKSSYLDRSMFSRWNPTPVIGVFQVRPITAFNAQEVIEYLWWVNRHWLFSRPLSRDFQETPTSFLETIYYSYTVGGDWGICDEIHFGVAHFSVDRETGEVNLAREDLREINGVCYE